MKCPSCKRYLGTNPACPACMKYEDEVVRAKLMLPPPEGSLTCPNPEGNLDCRGTVTHPGQLCRSCRMKWTFKPEHGESDERG